MATDGGLLQGNQSRHAWDCLRLAPMLQPPTLGGKNSQKGTVVIQDPICPFCGDQVAKHTKWVTFRSAKDALWTHLTFCDASTQCDGMVPGLGSEHILPFDKTPKLIEARMTQEGLLSYDSITEDSVARIWECILTIGCVSSKSFAAIGALIAESPRRGCM